MRRVGVAVLVGVAFAVTPVMAGDTPPHLDTSGVNMQPAYPASALKNNERGAAIIGVNVSETGKVGYAYLMETSGFDDLDRAAIAGVMGWRFIPASNNGVKVAGDSAVEVVFEPPDAAKDPTKPTDNQPPKPAGDFLPKTFTIEAPRGEYNTKEKPVLCANGTVRATLKLLHSVGPAASQWKPSAALTVKSGKDEVALEMWEVEKFLNPPEAFVMKRHQGNDSGQLHYSHMTPFGMPETVSLSWDSTGLVTAMVGALETHQARLSGPPTQFSFSASSGAAEFTNSALVCRPDNPA